MTPSARFIQAHILTAYPPNCLNRDDLGRPKSAVFGSAVRTRISSQSIKRAWRTSSLVDELLAEDKGVRTIVLWAELDKKYTGMGFADVKKFIAPIRAAFESATSTGLPAKDEKDAAAPAPVEADGAPGSTPDAAPPEPNATKKKGRAKKDAAGTDPAVEKKDTIFFFNAFEIDFIEATLLASLKSGVVANAADVRVAIPRAPANGDVALFGRMVADHNALRMTGAMSVAHVITVTPGQEEDDYLAATDDLKKEGDPAGAAHLATNYFSSGLYYGYVSINTRVLLKNLRADEHPEQVEYAKKLVKTFLMAMATVAPGGRQNTMSAKSYAAYMLAEIGNAQPRQLTLAYLDPVTDAPVLKNAIALLENDRDSMMRAFPSQKTKAAIINRDTGAGTFDDIEALVDAAFAS